jgi:hypothetical protein
MTKCRIEAATFVRICVFQFVTICGQMQINANPKRSKANPKQNERGRCAGPWFGQGLPILYTSFTQALDWVGWGKTCLAFGC